MSEVPRIVKPPIVLQPTEDIDQVFHRLYCEGWSVNSADYMKANTPEEAVELQAKSFPYIEFQPLRLSDGKYVAFHRTSVEEWLKTQGQKQPEPTEKTKPLPPIATTQEEEEAKLWRQDEPKPQTSEQQQTLGLQPEIVKKPKIVKCPKCGESAFDLIHPIEVRDMLSFDDETGEPFIALMNLNDFEPDYIPHKQCQRIECSKCGAEIPKELFTDLPDRVETELME